MTEERLNQLISKIEAGTITPQEELELLKAMNKGVTALRSAIAQTKSKSE